MVRYPLNACHPAPLNAVRAEIRRLRGSPRIGVIGFSAAGHLAGLAALADGADANEAVDFSILGYTITSMETETYRPARLILQGEDATPELRRAMSLDALVTPSSPSFFLWHTAEEGYVPVEHTYRLAATRAHNVPHAAMSSTAHMASAWQAAPATAPRGPIQRNGEFNNRETARQG